MPYIPGDNLADYIRNNPSLNEETRLKLCGELCRAVAALNQAGYIHNDLKPENIMVRTEGPGAPSVHVIDMGLACKQDDLAKLYPGSEQPRIGTRGYWAPEIYHLGAIGASSASDAWSLGCTLFFILTSFELMDGVLDKKSEQSQNELYESLATKENLNLPMISLERMIRSGISNQDIATALGQLLTPLRKHRNLASGALLAMAALCDNGGISTRHSEASPSPPPRSPVEEGVTEGGYSAERRGAPRSTDFVKIILTPDVGVRQFILVKEGRDNFARHQHLPMISTSHTKLIQFSFDGVTVYAVARDDLGELLIDGKPWNGMAPIYDGSLISIDGFEIGVEIR
jgi:serine/threonine protein kinase